MLVLSAIGIHIFIGSIYAWSQIAVSIKNQLGVTWGFGKITITFSIAICALGITAAFMGHFVKKRGPRMAGILSAFLFGIGYITPVTTLLK
ncbi:MAG: OFA family MFS transporter [Desulfobacteraceae bacterium]|nr:OFA family MFS transporter [Desulfobacteraceae bacterium]